MKLNEYLESEGLTQAQFADVLKCGQQAVSKYCAGRIPRDPEIVRQIERVTNGAVTIADFYAPAAKPRRRAA